MVMPWSYQIGSEDFKRIFLGPHWGLLRFAGSAVNDVVQSRLVGGHLVGVLSGLLAYHVLAHGLTLAALSPPLSTGGLRIVASGVVSIALTVALMSAARANHAPACATPLIVSLGVLSGLVDGVLIMAAVTGMFLLHRLVMLVAGGSSRP